MEFLSLLLLSVTIVVIFHVCQHLWKSRKPTEWQEPTDCDNNFCDCASLAHPEDKHPENRWKPVKYEPLKFEALPKSTPKECLPKIPRGYTRHYGGLFPVRAGTECSILLRAEAAFTTISPEDYRWTHIGSGGDIIAYKVVKKAPKVAKKATKKVTMKKKAKK